MIYTFKSLDTENRELFEKWQKQLGEEYKFTRSGFLSCAARILLKFGAENEYGIKYEDIEFAKTPQGKPYVKNGEFCFSISHSHDAVAVAISRENIGLDIQKIKEYSEKLSLRICSEKELKTIETAKDKTRRLFEIWSAKEAVIKFEGNFSREYKQIKSTEAQILDFDENYTMAVCGGTETQQIIDASWRIL